MPNTLLGEKILKYFSDIQTHMLTPYKHMYIIYIMLLRHVYPYLAKGER